MKTIDEKIIESLSKFLKNDELNNELIEFITEKIVSDATEQMTSNFKRDPESVAKSLTNIIINKAESINL